MQYTTDELRKIAKSREPQGWGRKDQALLYAANVIDAAQALIDKQAKEIDAMRDLLHDGYLLIDEINQLLGK